MNTPLAFAFSPATWTALDWANHLWQSSVVALVLLLLLACGRKLRARTRLAIGWMALIKFVLPISLLVTGAKQVGEAPARWLTSETFALAVNLPAAPANAPVASVISAPAPVASSPTTSFSRIALPIWLIGVVACGAGWTLLAWRARRRLIANAAPVAETVAAHVAEVTILAGLKTLPRCVAVPAGYGPALVGLWRPVVILPRGLEEALTAAEYRAVLLHEFVHLRRRDNLQATLRAAFGALLWFNPLVWLVNRRFRLEMEKACDERVLELTSDAQAYASGIVKTVRQSLGLHQPGFASVTTPPIVARIEDILAHGQRLSGKRLNVLALAAGVGVVGFSGHAGLIGSVRAADEPALAANSSAVDSGKNPAATANYADAQRQLHESGGPLSSTFATPSDIKLPALRPASADGVVSFTIQPRQSPGHLTFSTDQAASIPAYVLRPGDLIRVQVFQRGELNWPGAVRLSAESTVVLPLLENVDLKNKTVPQAQTFIRGLYARAGFDAPVTVAVLEYAPRVSQAYTGETTIATPMAAKEPTLSVDFPDEDIRRVLRNVGDLFELKLVLPDALQGKTTVKLNDVTWRQIFRAVLEPVGYTFVERDGVVQILPKENARSASLPGPPSETGAPRAIGVPTAPQPALENPARVRWKFKPSKRDDRIATHEPASPATCLT